MRRCLRETAFVRSAYMPRALPCRPLWGLSDQDKVGLLLRTKLEGNPMLEPSGREREILLRSRLQQRAQLRPSQMRRVLSSRQLQILQVGSRRGYYMSVRKDSTGKAVQDQVAGASKEVYRSGARLWEDLWPHLLVWSSGKSSHLHGRMSRGFVSSLFIKDDFALPLRSC